MNKNQNGRRTGSSRRVVSEYQRPEPVRTPKRGREDFERKIRYQQEQKRKRLAAQRRRALVALVLSVVVVVVMLFMTPLCNIRTLEVDGNDKVTLEEIDEKIGDLAGQNLFRTGSVEIKRRLFEIPYINTVTVSKRLIPPTVHITVTESQPAAYTAINSETVIIDSSLKILGGIEAFDYTTIPNIIGLEDISGKAGEKLEGENQEKLEILRICLSTMEQTGTLDKVQNLDLSEVTGIKFEYDGRLDVLCGTQLDLERKLRMFKEIVSNNNMADNARGTVDLSVTGNAVYDP